MFGPSSPSRGISHLPGPGCFCSPRVGWLARGQHLHGAGRRITDISVSSVHQWHPWPQRLDYTFLPTPGSGLGISQRVFSLRWDSLDKKLVRRDHTINLNPWDRIPTFPSEKLPTSEWILLIYLCHSKFWYQWRPDGSRGKTLLLTTCHMLITDQSSVLRPHEARSPRARDNFLHPLNRHHNRSS